MRSPLHRPGRPGWTFRFACLLLSAGLTLAGFEFYLRRFDPVDYRRPPLDLRHQPWLGIVHRRSSIPGLAYELAPGVERRFQGWSVRTNTHGMRDRPREIARTPGRARLAALGDSFTFGLGVDLEDTWPFLLEERLAVSPPAGWESAEVLNFGVAAYSAVDEAAVFEHRLAQWRPDAVIVGYVLNDPEIRPVQPLQAQYRPVAWWQHFHLTRRMALFVDRAAVASWGGGDYFRYLHRNPTSWSEVTRSFDRMAAEAGRMGVPVVLAIFPIVPRGEWGTYPYTDLHTQVAAAARDRGFRVVDLLPALQPHPPGRLRLSPTDHHLTPFGYRVSAHAIADSLAAWGIPAPPRSGRDVTGAGN